MVKDKVEKNTTIIIATGGTGGHVMPALAIAKALAKEGDFSVVLYCDKRGVDFLKHKRKEKIEGSIIDGAIKLVINDVANINGKYGMLGFLCSTLTQLLSLIFKPISKGKVDACILFGGYSIFPVGLWGALKRIKLIIHEQNAFLGRGNKLFAGIAKAVALSFPNTIGLKESWRAKSIVTGLPINIEDIAKIHISRARSCKRKFIVYVTGGSLGAKALSTAAARAISSLPGYLRSIIEVYHQCSPFDKKEVEEIYRQAGINSMVEKFFSQGPSIMAGSHLVIARAGAATIHEMALLKVPGIVIPYPKSKDNHQWHNAKAFEKAGFGYTLEESEDLPEEIAKCLLKVYESGLQGKNVAASNQPLGSAKAAENIVSLIRRVTA